MENFIGFDSFVWSCYIYCTDRTDPCFNMLLIDYEKNSITIEIVHFYSIDEKIRQFKNWSKRSSFELACWR